MAALVTPGPPPTTNGLYFQTPLWAVDEGRFGGGIDVSVEVQGSTAFVEISTQDLLVLSNPVDAVGTMSPDGTHIAGTYQLGNGSDSGIFTGDRVPLWNGTYSGMLTVPDPTLPNVTSLSVTLTENADYTLTVSGLPTEVGGVPGANDGFVIGNLVFLPEVPTTPSLLVGLRTDNSGLAVNVWEENASLLLYLGVVNKQ